MTPRRSRPAVAVARRRAAAALAAVAFAGTVLAGGLLAGCTGGADQPGHTDSPTRTVAPGPSGTSLGGPSSPGPAASGSGPGGWRHRAGLTWQWQLTGPLDLTVDADVYELDGFTTPAAAVATLRTGGRRVICYISVGAFEDFRPDARRFPRTVIGRENGWPGERWLDIRRWTALEPLLRERFAMCRAKGFDAVEADNVDGYANESGFPLRAADQLAFNRKVAALAHSLGLAIGLKNDLGQVAELEPSFDFAVNEECFRYAECGRLAPFVRAGKPVFHVEYDVDPARFCAQTRRLGLVSMRKHPDLDVWRAPC